jgi:DNA-binding SARP family transcriptional activator
MKKLALPIAIVAMMLLIGAAYTWDSVRAASAARHRVDLADQELQKQEQRLVKLLSENPKTNADMQTVMAEYKNAGSADVRRHAYEQLASAVKTSMSTKFDPTNPAERSMMDNILGAINRHEVAQKMYEEESAAYQAFLASFRGSLSKTFSSSARRDSKAADDQ